MCIFQSEQVIKLRNAMVSLGKRMAIEFASSKSIPWGATLGRCQKFTPKPSNTADLKTALLSIWNDLPQEFIDKTILSFRKRLDFRVLLQLVDILKTIFSLNMERAADIHHWNFWTGEEKTVQSLISYYWIFWTLLRVHL